jgi:hypothetical protein
VIFGRAEWQEAEELAELLRIFALWSGLEVNNEKSIIWTHNSLEKGPWSSHGYLYHTSTFQFHFDNQSTDLPRGSAIDRKEI